MWRCPVPRCGKRIKITIGLQKSIENHIKTHSGVEIPMPTVTIPVKAASQRGVNKRKAAPTASAGRNNVLGAPSRKVARASAQVDASPVSTPRVPSFGDPVVSSAARIKAGTRVASKPGQQAAATSSPGHSRVTVRTRTPSRRATMASAQVDAGPKSAARVRSFVGRVVSSAARTKLGTHVTSVDPGGTPAFTTYQPQQGVSAQFGTKPDIARLKVAQDRVDALRSRRDQGDAGSDSSYYVVCILYSRLCTTIIQASMWTPL